MNKQLKTLQAEYAKAKSTLEAWHKTDECQLQYAEEDTPEVMAAFVKGQELYDAKVGSEDGLVNWLFSYITTPAGRPKSIVERKALSDAQKMYKGDDYSKHMQIREGIAALTMDLRI